MSTNTGNKLVEQAAAPKDTAKFLKHFLVDELGQLINEPGQPFLKFLPLIAGIEFLGACYDKHPFEKKGKSKRRFKKGISLMGGQYRSFDGSQKQTYPCLYEDFRCPMVHQFRANQDKFRLTAVQSNGKEYIRSYHLLPHKAKYFIVLEELYDDFAEAVEATITCIQDGTLSIPKLKKDHVVIRRMQLGETEIIPST